MDAVQVKRVELIGRIERNRARHVYAYDEALKGWRKKLIVGLAKALRAARSGKEPKIPHLPKPQRFEGEYQRVLGMLRMSVDQTVKLEADDYDRYIRDKWEWSDAFANSTVGYGGRKLRKLA